MTALHTKLAPYRIELLRGGLQAMAAQAAQLHIPIVVILFPSLEPGDLSAHRIHDAQAAYSSLGIPVLDLTDTFNRVPDTQPYLASLDDASNLDVHPNARANAMILDDLYRKLREQPAAWRGLTGLDTEASVPAR
jgi:lysophospholipase L1-like esterase